MAPNARALTIGVNAVDRRFYRNWPGTLHGPENDANAMAALARARKFSPVVTLLSAQATREAVLGEIGKAAASLSAGDHFLLTFSGHGGRVPDRNDDEEDGADETWCLYNWELLDDELNAALAAFEPGVRVVVVADSCHSGTSVFFSALHSAASTLADAMQFRLFRFSSNRGPQTVVDPPPTPKAMPVDVAMRVCAVHRAAFFSAQPRPPVLLTDVKADILLLAACRDDQLCGDGEPNGVFTTALLNVWNGGAFQGTYDELRERIANLTPGQQPQITPADSRLRQSAAFTI